jgi:ferredoxin
MERLGAADLDDLTRRRAGHPPDAEPGAAARLNLRRYAETVADDPRYAAAHHRAEPVRTGPLAAWDCASCNNCVLVCPNGAFFSLPTTPGEHDAPVLRLDGPAVTIEPARWTVRRETQWVLFADSCNECGNCDTFCPEQGGPQRVKPRFHGTARDYEAAIPADGILVERGGRSVRARIEGVEYRITRDEAGARFEDGVIEVALDRGHRPIATRVLAQRDGHRLPLARYHQLRLLADAAMAEMNPVSARALPAAGLHSAGE